jgi:hypothetical protein
MKKRYLINFVLFFVGATGFGYIANLLFEWDFVLIRSIIQNFIVGILFSWILTQAQLHQKNRKAN